MLQLTGEPPYRRQHFRKYVILYSILLLYYILLHIRVKLRKTMIEDSRMTNFIFSDTDNDRNGKHDSLKNFREVINFVNIFTYIPSVI